MPNPPPIKTKVPLDEAEDVPRRIVDKLGKHRGDTVPTKATVQVDLFAVWPKLAVAALAGYALGALIHRR